MVHGVGAKLAVVAGTSRLSLQMQGMDSGTSNNGYSLHYHNDWLP